MIASDAAGRLLSLTRLGEGAGLHRMLYFLDSLPDQGWVQQLDAIKVTGSKGKGSTSAITAEILKHLGIVAGLYTSPHLIRFNERIQVNGEEISDYDLAASADWTFERKADFESRYPADRVGAFEAFTAAGLHHFCSKRVPAIVSEAGLGGRYDSTRVIPGATAALTSVELEHSKILGKTVEMIAYDKVDLCPPGGVLVAGSIDPALLRRVQAYCRLRQVELVDATAGSTIENLSYEGDRMYFDMACAGMEFRGLTTRLCGEHQARNTCVAVHLVKRWVERNRPNLSKARLRLAIYAALDSVVWPGRLERVSTKPEIIVDVGHTPHSVAAAAATIRNIIPSRRILLVTGVSQDKDIGGILPELIAIADSVVCTQAYHRGTPAAMIANACHEIRPGVVWKIEERIEDAVEAAVEKAWEEDMTIYVAGGLFVAVEAKVCIQGGNPRSLRFF